jgi:hypothetical protein
LFDYTKNIAKKKERVRHQLVVNYHQLMPYPKLALKFSLPSSPKPAPRNIAMKTVIHRVEAEAEIFAFFNRLCYTAESVSKMIGASV